ncbi:hypothetical protein [Streptomyces sp. NPDC047046]|uniref:hypothetical protein n=1 Tax=Streptomyces sp. NPDC047046 TaxID=3155378 RepID=UPI0033C00953
MRNELTSDAPRSCARPADGEFDRQFLDELDGSLVAVTASDTGATEVRISAEVADRTFTVPV